MNSNDACYNSSWTREEDKVFENGLAIIPEDDYYRWQKIAEMIPGKTVEEIKLHYDILVEDINDIEAGLVPLPCYGDSPENDNISHSSDFDIEEVQPGKMHKSSSSRRKSSRSESERRKKGIAWTEEEHRLFLEGLARYGRGDWRSISRLCVISRTPTQVASHAQKYFMRLRASANEKKRASVHDITDKGKAVESSNPPPPVKTRGSKGTGKNKDSAHLLSRDPVDFSNFVPPTIVQSSYNSFTDFKAPSVVAPTQMDIDYEDMVFFASLPDITTLP